MRRKIILVIAAVTALSVLLALDLAFRGAAWRLFWELTGEEAPLAQTRGMVEWGGSALRAQPQTAPLTVMPHTDVNPFGVNTFLQLEVEPEKRERQMQMIADAGFGWIRQQFPWEDIEIHARGDFQDRRNVDAIGVVDAWAKYDQIVDLAARYNVAILARLDNPPAWSHADPNIGAFAPPDDVQDYVNFAVAVAERYRGRLYHYQIWNEPNIYPEWGEQAVDPEAYTELLCRTYRALKAVDPQIVVLSAALSPTVALRAENLNEFLFLERMYAAGAGECFNVLSAQAYGFFSGPTDRRLRNVTNNYPRPLYLRDLMVAHGDADVPIWISEAGWNPIDSPEVPPDVTGRENFGVVTREQAAAYMPLAYERVQREWSWVGMMSLWFFRRPDESERGQSWYYFRMVEPDFTPLPIYDAMRAYITTTPPTLYTGVHQESDWTIRYDDHTFIDADGAQLGRAARTDTVRFTIHGTEAAIRWRPSEGESVLFVEIDEQPSSAANTIIDPDGWRITTLYNSLIAETHAFQLSGALLVDSITVADHTGARIAFGIGGALALCMVGVGAWLVWRRSA
jgi:hypothetical protein